MWNCVRKNNDLQGVNLIMLKCQDIQVVREKKIMLENCHRFIEGLYSSSSSTDIQAWAMMCQDQVLSRQAKLMLFLNIVTILEVSCVL